MKKFRLKEECVVHAKNVCREGSHAYDMKNSHCKKHLGDDPVSCMKNIF